MLVIVLYFGASVVLVGCGWIASAWLHQRRIALLKLQLRQARQTAAEHATQARRQIGQLQAELSARPPERPRAPEPASAAAADRPEPIPRVPAPAGSGFAPTELGPHGFEPTRLLG